MFDRHCGAAAEQRRSDEHRTRRNGCLNMELSVSHRPPAPALTSTQSRLTTLFNSSHYIRRLALMQTRQHSAISPPVTTFLIVCIFLLALFPSLFVSIFWAPYNSLVNYFVPAIQPRTRVVCTSPNICVAPPAMSWYVFLYDWAQNFLPFFLVLFFPFLLSHGSLR